MLIEQSYLFPPDVLYSFIRRVRYLYVYHGVYHISHTHNKHYWILVLLECSPRIHTCEYYSRHKRKKPPMSNIIFGRTPSQYCYWKTERGPWNNFRLLKKLYHCIWALTREVQRCRLKISPKPATLWDALLTPSTTAGSWRTLWPWSGTPWTPSPGSPSAQSCPWENGRSFFVLKTAEQS